MRNWSAVLIGGALGAGARYGMEALLPPSPIPFNVLAVNLLGSLIIGFVMAASIDFGRLSEPWRLFWTVGFSGGFTTFSSFVLGAGQLFTYGDTSGSLLYIGLSLIVGPLAAFLGFLGAGLMLRQRTRASDVD